LRQFLISPDDCGEVGRLVFMIEFFQESHLLVADVVCIEQGPESVVGLPENSSGRRSLVKNTV
jgi:hypothetical protein